MSESIQTCRQWYDNLFKEAGVRAQRQYPNEELCRFMGRNFFGLPPEERAKVKVLELGCGSGGNLWMIAREGFSAHGIDLSPESVRVTEAHLRDKWGVEAELQAASMTALPYADGNFSVIFEVLSACCLAYADFLACMAEVSRCLQPGGKFFAYTPTVDSDAFVDYEPAVKLDEWTLNGIYREGAAFAGNHYPLRFTSREDFGKVLERVGLRMEYAETASRTYFGGKETLEVLVVEATKA